MRGLAKAICAATGACVLLFSLMGTNLYILGIKNAYAATTTDNAVILNTKDLAGNDIPGLHVAIQDAAGNLISDGFSPFIVNNLMAGTY